MWRRRRRWLGIFIGLLVSLIAFGLALRWAGLEPLKQALLDVDYSYLGLAVILYLISLACRAACWRTLLGNSFSFRRVFAALNQGYLLNNVLPWRMGEIGRAVLLGRRSDLSVIGVLSSIMVERMYDIILALSFLIALLPHVVGIQGMMRSAALGGAVLMLAVFFLWMVLRHPVWVEGMLARLPGGSSRWSPLWTRFQNGLEILSDPKVLLVSFLWMALSWILAGVEYWMALRALLPNAEPLWAYFMLTITLLGVALPSSPGYIGVFEAAGVVALAVFGVPQDQALAATLVLHTMVYTIASGLGALALAADGETLGTLYRDVQGWRTGRVTL